VWITGGEIGQCLESLRKSLLVLCQISKFGIMWEICEGKGIHELLTNRNTFMICRTMGGGGSVGPGGRTRRKTSEDHKPVLTVAKCKEHIMDMLVSTGKRDL
jgi:hypothetical protein